MESSKGIIIASICGLLLVAGLSVYIHFSDDITSRRTQLEEVRANLKSLQEDLDTKNSLLDNTKKQLVVLQQHADNFNRLTNDKQLLTKGITELEETRKKMLGDFSAMVLKVRSASEGMELATVTLKSGQVLQGVKLQKITDASVSLSHSNGLIKVDGKDLPDDLRERFRYGMEPMITVSADSVPGATPPSARNTQAPSASTNGTPSTHYQIEIEAIDQKIAQLEKSKEEWSVLAASYRSQVYNAQSLGRPTYNSRTQAAQAEQTIQTLNTQISKLQEEQVAVRKKMASAMAAP